MKRNGTLGVSPAFFISKFDFDFDAERAVSMLPLVTELGYGAVQGEIAASRFVTGWIDGGIKRFGDAVREHGLEVRQFVAHYLLEIATMKVEGRGLTRTGGAGAEYLGPLDPLAQAIPDLRSIGEQLGSLPGCNVLTIPVGPIALEGVDAFARLSAFVTAIFSVLPTNVRVAVEALPGSPVATPDTMAEWLSSLSSDRVGVNLDTGHLWSQGIPPEKMIYAVGAERIFGTHICDNDGVTNDSLAPGRGSIEWERVFRALDDAGYHGPYDLEIRVAEEEMITEYTAARSYIETLVDSSPS